MRSLGDLFSAKIIPGFKEAHARHVIAETITKTLGVPVAPASVTYKAGSAFLKVAPVVKSAVQLNTEKLRMELLKQGITVSDFK